jgi:hypothetical protein
VISGRRHGKIGGAGAGAGAGDRVTAGCRNLEGLASLKQGDFSTMPVRGLQLSGYLATRVPAETYFHGL